MVMRVQAVQDSIQGMDHPRYELAAEQGMSRMLGTAIWSPRQLAEFCDQGDDVLRALWVVGPSPLSLH